MHRSYFPFTERFARVVVWSLQLLTSFGEVPNAEDGTTDSTGFMNLRSSNVSEVTWI